MVPVRGPRVRGSNRDVVEQAEPVRACSTEQPPPSVKKLLLVSIKAKKKHFFSLVSLTLRVVPARDDSVWSGVVPGGANRAEGVGSNAVGVHDVVDGLANSAGCTHCCLEGPAGDGGIWVDFGHSVFVFCVCVSIGIKIYSNIYNIV